MTREILEVPNKPGPQNRCLGPPCRQVKPLQPSLVLTGEDEQHAWHSISLVAKAPLMEGVEHGGEASRPLGMSPVNDEAKLHAGLN